MNPDTLLVCNMNVFTSEQREAHVQTTMELVQAIQDLQGVENGYEFRFPNETEFITLIAEFVSNEQLCCPFLRFQLSVPPRQEPISLTLTGPTGTQEFIREEFAGAFS